MVDTGSALPRLSRLDGAYERNGATFSMVDANGEFGLVSFPTADGAVPFVTRSLDEDYAIVPRTRRAVDVVALVTLLDEAVAFRGGGVSRLYVAQQVGGHEVDVSVTYEAPDGFALALIEEAERTGSARDSYGDSIDVIQLRAVMLVVTWEEPETGVAAYGPYGDERAAEADWGRVSEDFMNDGALPEDVEYHVVEAS